MRQSSGKSSGCLSQQDHIFKLEEMSNLLLTSTVFAG
jgi:hypothetical protein